MIGIHDIALGETYEGTSDAGKTTTRRVVEIEGKVAEHASSTGDRIKWKSGDRQGQCSALDFVRWADRRLEQARAGSSRLEPKVVRHGPQDLAGRW